MKELVAIKYQGKWNEIFSPRYPGGIDTDDHTVCVAHIKQKYPQFSNCKFVIEGNDMFAVFVQEQKLNPINGAQ